MRIDRASFYQGFRKAFGKLNQSQVNGIEYLIDGLEAEVSSVAQAAYMLATVKHETANTYLPIREYRNRPGTKGRANQDRYWLTGYYGRGYVQLTWKTNYEKVGKGIGVDLVGNPDLALDPLTAFKVMVYGMKNGTFTGKKISDYISGSKKDYTNARRVINGTDKAALIAGYAKQFEKILTDSRVQNSANATTNDGTPALTAVNALQDSARYPLDEPTAHSPNNSEEGQSIGEKITEKTKETFGDKSFESITEKFIPTSIPAFIPRLGKLKWISLVPGGGMLATLFGYVAGLPPWMLFALGVLTGLAAMQFAHVVMRHRSSVVDFIQTCYRITADPRMNNLIPTSASGYVGHRQEELLSILQASGD